MMSDEENPNKHPRVDDKGKAVMEPDNAHPKLPFRKSQAFRGEYELENRSNASGSEQLTFVICSLHFSSNG